MEKTLLVYTVLFSIALTTAGLMAMRSDQSSTQHLARVRVRVDDHRRERPEPPEEEFDPQNKLEWLAIGFVVILILMLAIRV